MDDVRSVKSGAHQHLQALGLVLSLFLAWLFISAWVVDLFLWNRSTANPFQLWETVSALGSGHRTVRLAFTIVGTLALLACVTGLFKIYSQKRELHGSARFATESEISKNGLFGKQGIILGKFGSKYLVFDGQEFVLLAAPTRSGKGVAYVIPNLLNWQQSAVITDVKLENYLMTSGWRQKILGQRVFLFNPFDLKGQSHRWNPLDAVRRDPVALMADVQQIANIFYPSIEGDKNRFFADSAQNLFVGLALYLIETGHPHQTMGEILRQGSGYGKPIGEHIQSLLETSQGRQYRDPLSRFLAVSAPETLGSIKATFDSALQIFAQPSVDWATSASDFDLNDLRRKPMSIYFGVPVDMVTMASRLQNLFFTQVINLNTRVLPEDDPSLKHQVLLCLDEFAALGRIPVIEKGAAYIAGYNLRLMPILQSRSQLADSRLYGRESAENIIANHGVKILFPPSTQQEAEDYSKMLGTYTAKSASTSISASSNHLLSINSNRSAGTNVSDQRRELMKPQELKQLPADSCIVDRQGIHPILAKKAYYYDDPVFLKRLAQVSPSIKKLLDAGQKSVSKDDVKAMRVNGEFKAELKTAEFMPLIGGQAMFSGSLDSPDDVVNIDLDAPIPAIDPIDTNQGTISHLTPEGEAMAMPNHSLEEASMPETHFLARLSHPAKAVADFAAVSPPGVIDIDVEAAAKLLSERLMDFSAAETIEDWVQGVAAEFKAFDFDAVGATS